jgi:hypothetical protein
MVQVAGLCTSGDTSDFSSTTTLTHCAVITSVPYFQNFEQTEGTSSTSVSTNNLPPCWWYNNTGTTTLYRGYPIVYSSSSYAHSGNNSMRFYTYYITMCRLIQACAEHQKAIIILDRPNPNGHLVDGPILDMKYKSGVGLLPIPVLHGMTLGELAQMANGEGWLKDGKKCDLTVIPCQNYTHQTRYTLPIAPSPNLPNMLAIYLYPSMCYFEGTTVSLGRGTDWPFQVYGHPDMTGYDF